MKITKSRILLNLGRPSFQCTEAERQQLREICPQTEIVVKEGGSSLEQFDGRSVSVLFTEEVPRDLAAWPQLRFIQSLASGMDYLRDHPVWKTDIAVCTAAGTYSVPIAQYITGALLLLAHRVPELLQFKASRQWLQRETLAASVLRGQTVGIVGYGSIGRESARQLRALGLRVVCVKRDPADRRDDGFNPWPGTGDPNGEIPERWFAPGEIREMLPLCNVLVVTAPRTPETTGLIGRGELNLLKKGARVIIASRGGIVVEDALVEALQNGHLAGAVVDTFAKEPLPADHPFFDVPNLILTPHMSGVYEPYWPQGFALFRENLRRFTHGQPLFNRANGKLGY